jgi:hypothetical protein
VSGKARIIVKGKGTALPLPLFSSIDPPLLVQLQREGAPAGQCWEGNYSISGIATNASGIVRGRSD